MSIQCLSSLVCKVPSVGCGAILGQMGPGIGISMSDQCQFIDKKFLGRDVVHYGGVF